jgi:hypothetical protein
LTTFIDHRLHPGRMDPYKQSTMDQINFDGLLTCSSPPSRTRYCLKRDKDDSRPSYRQRGARRSSGQDRKDQDEVGGFRPTPSKYKPEDRSLSKPAPWGIPSAGLSKPFVEPLFTCQRALISQARRMRGRRSSKTYRRQTHSNSASSRSPVVPAT